MTSQLTRLIVAEDEKLMRHAISVFLRDADDIEVVAMVESGEQAVEAAGRLRPDVVLMDIHMPVMDGITATRLILGETPQTKVVALTTLGSVEAAVPMLRAGARGYLLKDCDPDTLVASVRQVVDGEPALSPAVTMSLLHAAADGEGEPAAHQYPPRSGPSLTDGEMEVLRLLARGMNTAEMAHDLVLAEATVKTRLSKLSSKFGVDSRVRLLVRAAELGYVQPGLDRR